MVGENPMDQIDYIIENGFDKFNELQGEAEMQTELQAEEIVNKNNQYIKYDKPEKSGQAYKYYEDIDLDELVACKSITHGRLRYFSAITGASFKWQEYGDVQILTRREYRELFKDSGLVEVIEEELDWKQNEKLNIDRLIAANDYASKSRNSEKVVSLDDWKRTVEKDRYAIETTVSGGIGNKVIAQHVRYEYR